MKIYLIRHGESTSDVENRYGGDYDDHLTAKGQQQAKELSEKLTSFGIESIFSSPRFRSKETAEVIAKKLGLKVTVVDDIRERNRYGAMTGMKKDEAEKKFPDQVRLLEDPKSNLNGSENYDEFRKRVLASFQKIIGSRYSCIAVVSHGGPIKCILREVLKVEIRSVDDCGVLEFDYTGKKLNLIRKH